MIKILKARGKDHPPDMGTKHVPRDVLTRLLKRLDVKLLSFAGATLLEGADTSRTEDEQKMHGDEAETTAMTFGNTVMNYYVEMTKEEQQL